MLSLARTSLVRCRSRDVVWAKSGVGFVNEQLKHISVSVYNKRFYIYSGAHSKSSLFAIRARIVMIIRECAFGRLWRRVVVMMMHLSV